MCEHCPHPNAHPAIAEAGAAETLAAGTDGEPGLDPSSSGLNRDPYGPISPYFALDVKRADHSAVFARWDGAFVHQCLEPMGPHPPWSVVRGLRAPGAAGRYTVFDADRTTWEFEARGDRWHLVRVRRP